LQIDFAHPSGPTFNICSKNKNESGFSDLELEFGSFRQIRGILNRGFSAKTTKIVPRAKKNKKIAKKA
jgi:hypothetical protein